MDTRTQNKDKKKVEKNIVVYDTETTGLNPSNDKIVEFSFSKLINNTGDTILINPEIEIPEKVSKINGITNDMIQKCKKFKEIISDLEKDIECKNKDDKTYLVAHNNIGFDEPFLREEYRRINRKVPENYVFIDTLPISRKLLGNQVENHQLQTLKKHFNIKVDDSIAHTAKADVVVLAELWENLKELANEDRMIELSIASKKKMPFGKHKNELISEISSNYIKWMISQKIFSTKPYLHNIFMEYNEFYRINN
jgi:DNA polymerase III epsilon subunit family exonuclease